MIVTFPIIPLMRHTLDAREQRDREYMEQYAVMDRGYVPPRTRPLLVIDNKQLSHNQRGRD